MGDAADSHLACSVCFAAFDGDQRRPWVRWIAAGAMHNLILQLAPATPALLYRLHCLSSQLIYYLLI
jgi:hypothetical protein